MHLTCLHMVVIGTIIACITVSKCKTLLLSMTLILALAYTILQRSGFGHIPPTSGRSAVSSLQSQASNKPSLKATPNPYLKTKPEENAPSSPDSSQQASVSMIPPEIPTLVHISGEDWLTEQQKRYESQVYQGSSINPSKNSRMRLLESMYDELEATNVKRDPFLNYEEDERNECRQLRGQETNKVEWTPF